MELHQWLFSVSANVHTIRRLSWSSRIISGSKVKQMVKIGRIAAWTEVRYLELRKRKHFKYLFDYGDHLIHTIEVLGIYDRSDEKNVAYPRIIEKVGEPPPQYGYSEE